MMYLFVSVIAAVIVAVILGTMVGKNENKFHTKSAIGAFILSLLAFSSFAFFETINTGERGVLLSFGKYERTLGEGLHFVNPVTTELIVMQVRTTKLEASASAASKDLQTVTSLVALNYHPNPEKVGAIYQTLGRGYEESIVVPAIQEAVKSATAKYTAEELISKRELVKEDIRFSLSERLGAFNLIVDDFSVINFDFSPQFNSAIEAKVTAEQDALASKNKLEQVKFESQQAIEKAKAEAESTRLQMQALQGGSEVIELRKVEAMLEMAKKWNGQLPQNIYGSAPLPIINLQ